MSPSTADFSEIAQLREFRRLYEEQEDKVHLQLQQKDELIADLRQRLNENKDDSEQLQTRLEVVVSQAQQMGTEHDRQSKESQAKTDKLMERIKELNQRLVASGG